jgi:acetolactate synthase I/II/III large subunit
VYVNGMSRGILPSDHPNLFALTRKHALRHADVVLALGIDFDFRLGYGRGAGYGDDVQVIHVDPEADKARPQPRRRLGAVADVGAFLRALLEHEGKLGRSEDPAWLVDLRADETRRAAARAAARHRTRARSIRCGSPARSPSGSTPTGIVIGDGGDIVAHTAGFVRVDRPGSWMDPGPFGCLGVGAPFAMAAKVVHPDRDVTVVYGDGSFGFNGMELEAAARQGLPFVGVIGNDGAWGEMKAFHERAYGPEAMVAQDLSQDTAYERWRVALGGHGERVERPEDIKPALDRARESGSRRSSTSSSTATSGASPRPRTAPDRRHLPFVLTPTLARNRSRSTSTRRWRIFATISSPCRTMTWNSSRRPWWPMSVASASTACPMGVGARCSISA